MESYQHILYRAWGVQQHSFVGSMCGLYGEAFLMVMGHSAVENTCNHSWEAAGFSSQVGLQFLLDGEPLCSWRFWKAATVVSGGCSSRLNYPQAGVYGGTLWMVGTIWKWITLRNILEAPSCDSWTWNTCVQEGASGLPWLTWGQPSGWETHLL